MPGVKTRGTAAFGASRKMIPVDLSSDSDQEVQAHRSPQKSLLGEAQAAARIAEARAEAGGSHRERFARPDLSGEADRDHRERSSEAHPIPGPEDSEAARIEEARLEAARSHRERFNQPDLAQEKAAAETVTGRQQGEDTVSRGGRQSDSGHVADRGGKTQPLA